MTSAVRPRIAGIEVAVLDVDVGGQLRPAQGDVAGLAGAHEVEREGPVDRRFHVDGLGLLQGFDGLREDLTRIREGRRGAAAGADRDGGDDEQRGKRERAAVHGSSGRVR
jgi:hypothetical protein